MNIETDAPDLEADLVRDALFREALKDDRFALAVYKLLENQGFYKGADEREWSASFRQVARIVADLRGVGEDYLDFYCNGPEVVPPEHDTSFREHLVRLGWRMETEADRIRKRARGAALLRDVERLEQRPLAEAEAWSAPIAKRQGQPRGSVTFPPEEWGSMSADERQIRSGRLLHRLDDLALSGRVNEAEYDALSERFRRMLA